MFNQFKTFAAVIALSFAVPAFAQETTTEAEEPAATQEAAETEAPATAEERTDGLSTGAEVSDVGKTYIRSDHGDWELRCIKAPEGQDDICQLYQLLEDQQGNSVAEINLFSLPAEDPLAAGATIVTPLGTLLTKQLRLSVDGANAKVYPFTFCMEQGCFSRIGLADADIASMKAGSQATIVIVPAQAPDQTVQLKVSLTGFTAGFNAVTEASK